MYANGIELCIECSMCCFVVCNQMASDKTLVMCTYAPVVLMEVVTLF